MNRRKQKKKTPSNETGAPFLSPRLMWMLGIGLISLFWLVLKMFGMNAYGGDEHIYLYQAQLVSEGVAPYSGFAMAHPPLQAALTAVLLKVFGYQFLMARMLPVAWCLAGGVILAIMVRRESGFVASAAALALYILAYEPLRASSHFTGVNMTTTLLLAAFMTARTGRIKVCAGFCVAAIFTRLYAAPGVIALTVWILISDRRAGLRLIAWGAGIGTVVFLAVGAWTGFEDMVHNMLRYHAQKTPMKPESLANMKANVLFHNALPLAIFALSVPAMFGAMARRWKKSASDLRIVERLSDAIRGARISLPLLGAFTAVIIGLVLINMDRVWMYYFVPSFAFAAMAGGWLVSRLFQGGVRLFIDRRRASATGLNRVTIAGGVIAVACILAAFFFGPMLESRLGYYQKEIDLPVAKRTHEYTWKDGMLPGPVNDAVRSVIWSDQRTIGDQYWSYTYYLWHESRHLDVVDEITREIIARTDEGYSIFGDSGTVPLFALLSGRSIAAAEVDTNIQRYRSGNADPGDLIRRIDEPGTRLIILRNRFGIAGLKQVQKLIASRYKLVRKFVTAQKKLYLMYERKPEPDGDMQR